MKTHNYLLVVDDSEIKEGDYWHYLGELGKPILNYLHSTWYDNLHDRNNYKKVIAHIPLNGSPILEGVDLLPPYSRHQEDGVDDAVIRFKESWIKLGVTDFELSAFSEGYNKAREKYKYTEDDMRKALLIKHDGLDADYVIEVISNKYPTEFECEMESVRQPPPSRGFNVVPITVISAQGVEWVGKYK
jgi:hypothetical protein